MKNVVVFLDNIRTEKSSVALLAAEDVYNLRGIPRDEKVIIRDEIDPNGLNAPLNAVKDARTRATFVEVADIQESTSTSLEIARAFFLTDLCLRAESMKIIFVVDYDELLNDAETFLELLKFSTVFTTNFTSIHEGVGLVVTEINDDDENDRMIKNRIVDFLNGVRENFTSTEDVLNADHLNKLINAFLERKNDDFPRIGLVRQLFEEGPLDEKLRRDKRYLETMISQGIPKISNHDDFFYCELYQ